ncbi:MAG: hypothetical protein ACRYFU_11240 [Janthinobacterium lividum]
MRAKLALGVTCDFVNSAPASARFSTYVSSPLFFFCCLLTSVPRQRESQRSMQPKKVPTNGMQTDHWSAAH